MRNIIMCVSFYSFGRKLLFHSKASIAMKTITLVDNSINRNSENVILQVKIVQAAAFN